MKMTKNAVHNKIPSPLGTIVLAATDTALVGLWFDGQRHQPDPGVWPLVKHHPVLDAAKAQLAQYFAGDRHEFDLPLDLSGGTEFQQQVWAQLQAIASGSTVSYGQLSQQLDKPKAVRAVGAAVGRNPISIVVPCHRVLGANGALTALLHLESRM
jgi:methylated-DNA-[protein]-cysteine S-methyltransferase